MSMLLTEKAGKFERDGAYGDESDDGFVEAATAVIVLGVDGDDIDCSDCDDNASPICTHSPFARIFTRLECIHGPKYRSILIGVS
jgi:hypothetical protein